MKNLFANWKTTSAGLLMIAGAVVHLIFAIINKHADENTWINSIGLIIGGVGLIYAGDASVTTKQVKEVKDAVVSGDTSMLSKPEETKP